MAKAKRMSDVEFVKLYMEATSAEQAAKLMGCTPNNVYNRRRKMLKEGVNLPEFERTIGKGEKDVVGLNALIESLKGKSGETAEGETVTQGETAKTETQETVSA